MEREDLLILDIETSSCNLEGKQINIKRDFDTYVKYAKIKWFGAYSYLDDEYYLLNYKEQKEEAIKLLTRHSVIIGFNQKEFDNPIINNNTKINLKYRTNIDMLNVCKIRLVHMGIKVKDFKLRTIAEKLKFDTLKGEIDYEIFEKDVYTKEETIEIKKYLKGDLIVTKLLFEYIRDTFAPLKKYLSEEDKRKFVEIVASPASLAYSVICNIIKIKVVWEDVEPEIKESFLGGHHIENIKPSYKGNIVSIDFVSAYPHAIMQCNLMSLKEDGWNGGEYYDLKGSYDNKTPGVVESAYKQIFLERLKAKENKEKEKNVAFKIVINAFYGSIGNWKFKNFYNPMVAGDVTKIVRTWLKYLAAILEHHGYKILYGFTDNVYVLIPEGKTEKDLTNITDNFIKKIKENVPFPQDTFKLDVEKRLKFIHFFAKNCYLSVNDKNEIERTSTLLNKNTPKIVMQVYDNYMSPKIIKQLNIDFTEKELLEQLKLLLEEDITLALEDHNVTSITEYKSKTSLHYQISEKHGEGCHPMIVNKKGIGVGKAKSTKKKIGVRYCTLKEFQDNKLNTEDVDTTQLMKHLKPFITIKREGTLK